jgi:hypothetical protein
MSSKYELTKKDLAAIRSTASNLGLDPYSFGAILQKESGMNPNIWGGAGGNYYGAIQFGGPERKEAGLDPNKIGNYTLAEQLPYAEKWLRGRGFETGMSAQQAYATILGGNPYANIDAPDLFGTTVRKTTASLLPGGDLYKIAQQRLGQSDNFSATQQPTGKTKPGGEQSSTDTTSTDKSDSKKKASQNYLQQYLGQLLSQPSLVQRLIQQDMTQGLVNPQLPQMPTSLSNLFY